MPSPALLLVLTIVQLRNYLLCRTEVSMVERLGTQLSGEQLPSKHKALTLGSVSNKARTLSN